MFKLLRLAIIVVLIVAGLVALISPPAGIIVAVVGGLALVGLTLAYLIQWAWNVYRGN